MSKTTGTQMWGVMGRQAPGAVKIEAPTLQTQRLVRLWRRRLVSPSMSTYYPDHVFFQHDHDDLPQPRNCSVKGCSKPLPNGYMLKMCEACRGRHRVYASTKRAKRKLEKLAVIHSTIGGGEEGPAQTVGWMPPDEPPPPLPPQHDTMSEEPPPESEVSAYFPPATWSQIDPRLFNPTSSELAGALTLPPIDPQRSPTPEPTPSPAPSTSAHPVGPSSPQGLPPRYCSVKGCKTIMSGDYLFKMCQSCRDRYRVYGNTKRNKWKRERQVAAATLQNIRNHEDQRPEEAGIPPMSTLSPADSERRAWEDSIITPISADTSHVAPPEPVASTSASASASPPASSTSALPLRMCTVSHCHAILPSTYEFRRCEQHRLQNRHHSKLKRVRDKEHKAVVPPTPELPDPPAEPHEPNETQIPAGLTSTFHSARTSHTCTLKHCANLLPPHTPWKMCDMHREKDREQRRRKAERDRAVKAALALAPAAGVEGNASGEPAAAPMQDGAEPQSSDMPTEMQMEEEASAFMEPLLPPDEYDDPISAPAPADASAAAVSSSSSPTSDHVAVQEIVNTINTITASTETPPAKKRKTVATATTATTATTTPTPAPQTHPHYQVPYYMPPPYSMSYPPGTPPFYAPHAHALPYPPFGGPFPSFVPWGIPGIAYPQPVPATADKAKDEAREKEAREKDKERTKEKARDRAKERRDRKRTERGLQIVMVDPARRREPEPTPAPSPAPAAKPCGGTGCTRAVVGGALCERCRARLKRRQERVKMRLGLEKRRAGGSARGVSVVG